MNMNMNINNSRLVVYKLQCGMYDVIHNNYLYHLFPGKKYTIKKIGTIDRTRFIPSGRLISKPPAYLLSIIHDLIN